MTYTGALHHALNRGHGGEKIFSGPESPGCLFLEISRWWHWGNFTRIHAGGLNEEVKKSSTVQDDGPGRDPGFL